MRWTAPLLAMLLCASCATTTGEVSPSPTPTQPEHVFYRLTETGINVNIDSRREYDAVGALLSSTGTMDLRYRYRFRQQSESGSVSSDCWTDVDEDGAISEPPPQELEWSWLLDRTLVSDRCFIGLIPTEVTYAWDSSEPLVLWSDRFGNLEARYTLAAPPTVETGPLNDPPGGTWETLRLTLGSFEYTAGDLED